MKKYILLISLSVVILIISSCSSNITFTNDDTITETKESSTMTQSTVPTNETSNIDNELHPQPPDDITWLSPAKVYIDNFHENGRAEWILTVHNGNQTAVEKKICITEPNETIVNIDLKYIIYGDKSSIKLESDNPNDNLEVTGIVGDDSITVKGFVSDQSRIIIIEYPYYSKYNISYRLPDHPLEGYVSAPKKVQDWVIITDSTPVLAPLETREILIAVEMPAGEVIKAKNWEFWISVMDVTTLGIVTTEICSRWLVTMRD